MKFKKIEVSSGKLAVISAGFMVLANNQALFCLLRDRLDLWTPSGLGFVLAWCAALIGALTALLLMFGVKYALKPLVIGLTLLSAIFGYFTNQLGVVFDEEMIHNIVENIRDQNVQEALELLSAPLGRHVLLFGCLPTAFVLSTQVTYGKFLREALLRGKWVLWLLLLAMLLALPNYKFVAYFTRENRDLRVWATPTYALAGLWRSVRSNIASSSSSFKTLGADARQVKASAVRTVGVMVLGETARADHFSLNGYKRETNPRLAQRELFNFSNVHSSGTSTAYSVPCMFSFLGRKDYSARKATHQSNVVDVLELAGVEVEWVDNNSSSKGVCDRIGSTSIRDARVQIDLGLGDLEVFDEELLLNLNQRIDALQGDVLVVLHTMGSHGPAYHRRYPPEFEGFKPSCKQDAPQLCSDAELVNSYDNTILYTDYILDRVIETLEERDALEACFMFYVSDHGESLGENGIYLHGLPYFLAPETQTHVPMLAWFSAGYRTAHAVHGELLKRASELPYSHDNISHTLLGMFEVQSSVYEAEFDIFR